MKKDKSTLENINLVATPKETGHLTYIFNAFLVDSLASPSSLLANHNALQQGVNDRGSKGVIKGHDLHVQ